MTLKATEGGVVSCLSPGPVRPGPRGFLGGKEISYGRRGKEVREVISGTSQRVRKRKPDQLTRCRRPREKVARTEKKGEPGSKGEGGLED